MLRTGFIACAQVGIVDKFTNLVSAIGVLDALTPPAMPFWIPNLMFIAVVHRDHGDPEILDGHLFIELGQEEIGNVPVHIDFQGVMGIQSVTSLQGIGVTSVGELNFRLQLPGMNDSSYIIRIMAPAVQRLSQIVQSSSTPAITASSESVD